MRAVLDSIYRISGYLAALSLMCIAAIVFGQVFLNMIDWVALNVFNSSFGLLIPSYGMLSGYALAFATFLSLGLGLRKAAHIRITLIEARVPAAFRRASQTLACACAVFMGVLFTWGMTQLAWQSWQWGDKASGLLRIPLWIPQTVLSVGMLVFLIAAVDTLIEIIRTGKSDALREESPGDEVA